MSTTTVAKERPIIFSGPMVRAILDGRKTQTRRVLNPQPVSWQSNVPGCEDIWGWEWRGRAYETDAMPAVPPMHSERLEDDCPYGRPGDRLWVRETWNVDDVDATTWMGGGENWGPFRQIPKTRPESAWVRYQADDRDYEGWRPSIHMPRWASRITLEIVRVRVERLQDISIDEILVEGIERVTDDDHCNEYWREETGANFVALWEGINGPGSWDLNPWVWVIEFRRV